MSTALRSVGLLDVLSSTPVEPSGRAPCIHARLRRLATKSGEKCGLEFGSKITCLKTAKAATNGTNFSPIRVIRGCLKKTMNFHASWGARHAHEGLLQE